MKKSKLFWLPRLVAIFALFVALDGKTDEKAKQPNDKNGNDKNGNGKDDKDKNKSSFDKDKDADKNKDSDKDKDKEEESVVVKIDFEGISQRILALPIPARLRNVAHSPGGGIVDAIRGRAFARFDHNYRGIIRARNVLIIHGEKVSST